MHVIKARNVNDAYLQGLDLLDRIGEKQPSRAGEVIVAPCPVTTVYSSPTERVLLDPTRDANPFFHLFESLWMLGGRQDAAYLNQFVRDFGARFAESSGVLHGAYGHRWRGAFDDDQLDVVVKRLRYDPLDRRVVIQMWDANHDLVGPMREPDGSEVFGGEPRDLPCNTQIYLRIRKALSTDALEERSVLDLTVTCRSNDVIWGAYGANAVHFSVLQEYLAARIGVEVGAMYQVSNNWHGYVDVLRRVRGEPDHAWLNPYAGAKLRPRRMFTVPQQIDTDVRVFLDNPLGGHSYANSWFPEVAIPMLRAHIEWREGDLTGAQKFAEQVDAEDWRVAAQRWLQRRHKIAETRSK